MFGGFGEEEIALVGNRTTFSLLSIRDEPLHVVTETVKIKDKSLRNTKLSLQLCFFSAR
jgi:hypothetical protein